MDPQAAWLSMMEAMRFGDYDQAAEIASDLDNWLTHGGFPPVVVPELSQGNGDPLSVPWKLQRQLAMKACEFILFMA
jgi:hypothetical protein